MSEGRNPAKLFVGDLSRNASEHELEDSFSRYGTIRNVWIARNPPGFAFVEFEDPRDADQAVKKLDGSYICGGRVRVEHSNGPSNRGSNGKERRVFNPNDRCFKCNERGHYAYDCTHSGWKSSRSPRRRSYSRERSPDRRRRPRRSRSNSRRRNRSYSRSSSDSYRRKRSSRYRKRSYDSSDSRRSSSRSYSKSSGGDARRARD